MGGGDAVTTRRLTWAVLTVGALAWCGYLAATQKHSPVKRAIDQRRDERRQQPWQVTFTVPGDAKMPTRCNVTEAAQTISGSIGVFSQTDYPLLISSPTNMVDVQIGSVRCLIEDLSTSGWALSSSVCAGADPQPPIWPLPPGGPEVLLFVVCLESLVGPPSYWNSYHEFIYMTGASDDDIERAFSVMISGRRIWRTATETAHYGRATGAAPVHSSDRVIADAWQAEPNPWQYAISFGGWSLSGTQTEDPGNPGLWLPTLSSISQLQIQFEQHKGGSWIKYADATDLRWSGKALDFSGMSKTYGNPPPGVGGKITGGLGSLELTYNDTAQRTSTWLHGIPRVPDFTRFAIRRRDGSLLSEARLSGPWRCSDEVPDSRNWSTTP